MPPLLSRESYEPVGSKPSGQLCGWYLSLAPPIDGIQA
jgi:hypothetical protein